MKKLAAVLLAVLMLFTACACAEGYDIVISDMAVTVEGAAAELGSPVARIGFAEDEAGNTGLRFAMEQSGETAIEAILAVLGDQLVISSNMLPQSYYISMSALPQEADPAQSEAVNALVTAAMPAIMSFAVNVKITEQDGGYGLTVPAAALNALKNELVAALNAQPEAVKALGMAEAVAALSEIPDLELSLQGSLTMAETGVQAALDFVYEGAPAANISFALAMTGMDVTFELTLNAYIEDEKIAIASADGKVTLTEAQDDFTYFELNLTGMGETYTLILSYTEEGEIFISFADAAGTLAFTLTLGNDNPILAASLLADGEVYALALNRNENATLGIAANGVTVEGAELFTAAATAGLEETDGAWLAVDTTDAVDLLSIDFMSLLNAMYAE